MLRIPSGHYQRVRWNCHPFRKFWCPIPFTEFLVARGTVVLTEYLAAGDGALEVP